MRFRLLFLVLAIGSFSLYFVKNFYPSGKTVSPSIHYPVTEQKPFVVVIPSFNNEKYVEKNLRSVFTQDYDNYRVIYIDDHSRDKTFAIAQKLFKELDTQGKSSLVRNPANFGALANIYNAVHGCHDHEIVVLLDGDDFFAHENVLKTLNQAYADPNVWMTYGTCLDYPAFQKSPTSKKFSQKVHQSGSFRNKDWATTHLRTFYATIFKEIKIEDLFYRGRFYPMSWDLAIMMPMLEMSRTHASCIEDILYLHNIENPISDHKIHLPFLTHCLENIRAKPAYAALQQLPVHGDLHQTADLIIFSENHPMQLFSLLESIHNHVVGLKKITVLYQTSSPEIESLYLELKMSFVNVHFLKMDKDLSMMISTAIFDSPVTTSKYILFAQDTMIATDFIDLSKAIYALELSKAYGMFLTYHQGLEYSASLTRHQPTPPTTPLLGLAGEDIPFAWQFSAGMDDWNTPHPFSFALYRKADLKKIFNQSGIDTLDSLIQIWSQHLPSHGIGLCYTTPKSVYLRPSSAVSEQDLIEMFEEGLKIDLTRMSLLKTPSQEIVTDLTFIPRE